MIHKKKECIFQTHIAGEAKLPIAFFPSYQAVDDQQVTNWSQ